jgi:CheY-like chemotaxis protein
MAGARSSGLKQFATRRASARGRVLLVQEAAEGRDALLTLLRGAGWNTVAAASVPEAVWILSKTPVDVALADVRLAGGRGLETVRRLRSSAPDTPLVILTGHDGAQGPATTS